MSLIERAVHRLTGSGIPTPNQGAATEEGDPGLGQKANLIEVFADRAAMHCEGVAAPSIAREPSIPAPSASMRRAGDTGAIHVELEPLRARGFVMPDGESSLLSQEFRVIKRPLIANAFGKGVAPVRNGKRIMITSAFPGEGKSFCAINLALSIAAERDNKVLLVDADVARPSIPRVLGITAQIGLMDWLINGNLDVADLVLSTDIDKLAVLPAGRRHDQATEFLASASMSRLLDQITSRFPDRIVVFDSPPLLVTTEARVLASYMGQIVMVVEAGRTPRAAVTEALSTIEGTAEVVGTVLNKARGAGAGSYGGGYGGHYGYGYGYGYGSRAP